MTTRENRRSKLTRRLFRESLTELMLEKGMQKISVNEICKRADMNRSTFYAHYEDQFDLLREIEDEFLIALRKTVTESNLQNFAQRFEKYLGHLYQNGSLFTLLMREAPDFRDKIIREAFNLYEMRKESGVIVSDDPCFAQKLYFVSGGSLLLLEKWIEENSEITTSEMADMIYSFWDGINGIT